MQEGGMLFQTLALVEISEECDGCSKCVDLCPFESLSLEKGKAKQVGPCFLCGGCEALCPKGAIEIVPLIQVRVASSLGALLNEKAVGPVEDCVFCKIIKGELPARVVYEDEDIIAFLDINPAAPGHTLVVPKKHYKNILDAPDEVVSKVFLVAKKIGKAAIEALDAKGVNVITNAEPVAGQIVMHFHVHVIPRFKEDELKFVYGYKYKEGEADEVARKLKEKLSS
ncbi:histidine triad (HIT) protein [Ignicoccus pacificus DSM 13166]|uniref:Histidine triad (HIT) protein n=1 Tax=Ignicoccus pacificus DSM 13166 TaxID=940294 RepID=A0A977PKY8_9CREN|nr:histidine triad (HIT) protein [Ignicoccus pacificus DSM 13166]